MNSGFGTGREVSYQSPSALHRALTEFRVALVLNTNSFLILIKQNPNNLLLAHDMQIRILATLDLIVHISMSSILTPPVGPDVLQPPFSGIVRIEILQIFELAVAHLVRRVDESLLSFFAAVSALGDVDGTAVAVGVSISHAVVLLELTPSQCI